MRKENKAIIEMLICAFLWSIAGIFMKLIPWVGFAISSLRSLVAGTVILIYMLVKKYRIIVTKKTLLGGFLTACVYTCFACANKLTTASNAIVLQFTSPVFIVVFSAIFYKTRIKKADLITVILTLIGVALCFFDGLESGYLFGNIVAIASGAFMALMFMIVGNGTGENRFSMIFLGQMITFIIGLPFVLTTNPLFTISTVSYLLVLGVFQLGISYILYCKASEFCPPLACCLLGVLEPLLNPVWVAVFNGEKPGFLAFIGAVIVVFTITIWCALGGNEKEKEKES